MFLGPIRGAFKPSAFVTLLAFFDIYARHDLLNKDNKYGTIQYVVGGYEVRVMCFLKQDKSMDELTFFVMLCDGEFNEYIVALFIKITLIITHLINREKDIRAPLKRYSNHYFIMKPAPGTSTGSMLSKDINWTDIELNGFIVIKTLFVNIEFE
ncbi:hypothetical protein MTO96_043350 [Rhipicephalus appendiculatus]